MRPINSSVMPDLTNLTILSFVFSKERSPPDNTNKTLYGTISLVKFRPISSIDFNDVIMQVLKFYP